MTTITDIKAIAHVAGSAFALSISTETAPIDIPGEPSPDLATWGVAVMLKGRTFAVEIPGVWVSSVTPWTLNFTHDNTTPWPVGDYEVRLAFTAPDDSGRKFIQPMGLVVEVTR